jgi:hypothetical protein
VILVPCIAALGLPPGCSGQGNPGAAPDGGIDVGVGTGTGTGHGVGTGTATGNRTGTGTGVAGDPTDGGSTYGNVVCYFGASCAGASCCSAQNLTCDSASQTCLLATGGVCDGNNQCATGLTCLPSGYCGTASPDSGTSGGPSGCEGQECVGALCCAGYVCDTLMSSAVPSGSTCTLDHGTGDPTQCAQVGASCATNPCCGSSLTCTWSQMGGYVCLSFDGTCSGQEGECDLDADGQGCCVGLQCCRVTAESSQPGCDVSHQFICEPYPDGGTCLYYNQSCETGSCCQDDGLYCIDDGSGAHVCLGAYIGNYPPGLACVADHATCKPSIAPCCNTASVCQFDPAVHQQVCE